MANWWDNIKRNLPQWLWQDQRNIAIVVLLILVCVLSAALVFSQERRQAPRRVQVSEVEILPPEILPVPKELVWFPCSCGIGQAWRQKIQEEPMRIYKTELFELWPCGDLYWYHYAEYKGATWAWYGTKVRDFWFNAPEELAPHFVDLINWAPDVTCMNWTPTPTETPVP